MRGLMKLAAGAAMAFTLAWAAGAQTEWLAPEPAVIGKFQGEASQHSHIM
jgi:hypothetical protein